MDDLNDPPFMTASQATKVKTGVTDIKWNGESVVSIVKARDRLKVVNDNLRDEIVKLRQELRAESVRQRSRVIDEKNREIEQREKLFQRKNEEIARLKKKIDNIRAAVVPLNISRREDRYILACHSPEQRHTYHEYEKKSMERDLAMETVPYMRFIERNVGPIGDPTAMVLRTGWLLVFDREKYLKSLYEDENHTEF